MLEAVIKVMGFWLDRGVDGLRLDAVPYLIEREGTNCENLEETHVVLRRIRAALDAKYPGRMLLAEANQWPADVRPYFGDGDECQMAFHFPLMPRMFMGIRQEDRHPIVEILRQTPDIPENCQWAMFLRNHDELTLEMVTDEERDYMYQAYAADPQMRINVGIRRRLAPLLENSRRRIELLNSLLFSMPGTPIIYYGDEIGMGDNIYLGDRNGVRTPMQWTGDRNAGFSRADPARLYAPPIMDPVYGYQAINVEAQERAPFSLLNWMKRMIGLRKQATVFGRGTIEFLPAQNRKVLAFVRRYQDEVVLCVCQPRAHRAAGRARSLALQGHDAGGDARPHRVPAHRRPAVRPDARPVRVLLVPRAAGAAGDHRPRGGGPRGGGPRGGGPRRGGTSTAVVHAPALLVGAAWETLLDGNVRTLIERDLLLPFLQRQRWYGDKARPARKARFVDWGALRRSPQPLFLTVVEVEFEDGGPHHYFLPLTICAYVDVRGLEERAPHAVLATITGARKGLLFDAWLDDRFARTVLEILDREERSATKRGSIRALKTAAFARLRGPATDALRISRMSSEQSNTSIVYGDRLILKLFRRLEPGINPDFEIGRQLTEKMRFRRVPAVAGALEYAGPGDEPGTIAMMQQFIESQADGWTHATDEVGRFFDQVAGETPPARPAAETYAELIAAEVPKAVATVMGGYLGTAETLGRRTAEMHLALAADSTDKAFAPEPFSKEDYEALVADAIGQAHKALQALEAPAQALPPGVAEGAALLLQSRDTLFERIRSGADAGIHRLENPRARRLPPRAGAVVRRGFLPPRFRRRAGAPDRGAPAQAIPAQRRGRHDAVLRLRGVRRALRAHGVAPAELERLDPWARIWQIWTTARFLRGYVTAADGAPFLPALDTQRDALLQLFVLDKALYELNYELNNRPDWVRIPLRGIFDLLNAGKR